MLSEPGVKLVGERNPNFFKDTWFDGIEMITIADVAARTNAYLSGEVHFIDRADLKTQLAMAAENLPRGRVDVEHARFAGLGANHGLDVTLDLVRQMPRHDHSFFGFARP